MTKEKTSGFPKMIQFFCEKKKARFIAFSTSSMLFFGALSARAKEAIFSIIMRALLLWAPGDAAISLIPKFMAGAILNSLKCAA